MLSVLINVMFWGNVSIWLAEGQMLPKNSILFLIFRLFSNTYYCFYKGQDKIFEPLFEPIPWDGACEETWGLFAF